MGCDIHAHFEILVSGKWLHYDQPKIQRNYALFEKIAGVRGSICNAISSPRGLPFDISDTTVLEAEWIGDDGHSHSWLNADEIAEVIKFHRDWYGENNYQIDLQQWGFLCGNGWDSFLKHREDYPKEIDDIRLVFWFDN